MIPTLDACRIHVLAQSSIAPPTTIVVLPTTDIDKDAHRSTMGYKTACISRGPDTIQAARLVGSARVAPLRIYLLPSRCGLLILNDLLILAILIVSLWDTRPWDWKFNS